MKNLMEWLHKTADDRTDFVYRTKVLPSEQHKNARQANKAFWDVIKAKVSPDVFEEIRAAYLKAEPIINAGHAFSDDNLYMQGFFDGMQAMGMELARGYHHVMESERELMQRDRETIRKLEQAANGGAKVGA